MNGENVNDLKIVFSDFDGTLTQGETLDKTFFEILSFLKSQSLPLVIVTGRSKSWAHFLLTHIPYLEFVLSEGGGVLSKVELHEGSRHLKDELLVSEEDVAYLANTTRELQESLNLELSVDSFGRQTDRAIELSSLKDLNKMNALKELLTEKGLTYSTSSVHLNFWKGDISKIKGIEFFLKNYTSYSLEECIYFGDSLNDESVFKGMKNTVGVSNLLKVIDRLKYKPQIILGGSENEGPKGVLSHLRSLK